MTANAKPLILGHDNRFLDGSPVASDTANGYDVLNIQDLRPFTWWQASASGTIYISVDCGSAKDADCLGIIGHNFYTASATISVESSATGAWTGEQTERLAGFTVTTDKAILKTFTSANAQYWRVKIVTAAIAPKIAVCVLGEMMEFERYLTGDFDPAPETLNAIASRSKAGHMIGAVLKNISIQITADWKTLTTSFIENTFRPVWDDHLSQLKPFFFAWDTTNHNTEVYFVVVPEAFSLNMPFDPYYRSLSLTMEGVKEV